MLTRNDKLFLPLIGGLSIAVPLIVAALIFLVQPKEDVVQDFSFLPMMNAVINSTVSVLLVLGVVFIRQKKIPLHRTMMISAFVLSTIFLLSYVIYHYVSGDREYTREGTIRYVYYFVLASHILLSIAVVPLALLSIYRGTTNQIAKHKRLVRWTFPIWLYVSVTGVIVYLMAHVYN